MLHLKTFQKVEVFSTFILSLLDEEMSMKNAQIQLELGQNDDVNE